MSEEEIILIQLYKNAIDCMCWYPQPATSISYTTKISLYKTRKILHKLQNEGIVKFERGYELDFYCGWELTDKGKENNKYKEMYEDYCKWQDGIYKSLAKFLRKGE